ncbi:RNA polymerase sigma factor [Olleya sp. R77988]|uniref:RNA polymerase sigma factor n=1 Tax=Olleya sp. R77988 TaxID=3093875 RepID=UPI0037C5B3E0
MKSSKKIDAQLVEQFQSGNAKALTVLVKKWHKDFCIKAYWIVKDKDLAKDIAQDSWKVIIAKISDLKDAKNFGSWAMRIVYSKSFDTLREYNKQKLKQEEYAKTHTIEDSVYQDNSLLTNRLLKAINKLSEKQQIVVKLFYVEDYSIKEISNLLNISVGTTKSRLFHAREQLKKQVKHIEDEK